MYISNCVLYEIYDVFIGYYVKNLSDICEKRVFIWILFKFFNMDFLWKVLCKLNVKFMWNFIWIFLGNYMKFFLFDFYIRYNWFCINNCVLYGKLG